MSHVLLPHLGEAAKQWRDHAGLPEESAAHSTATGTYSGSGKIWLPIH